MSNNLSLTMVKVLSHVLCQLCAAKCMPGILNFSVPIILKISKKVLRISRFPLCFQATNLFVINSDIEFFSNQRAKKKLVSNPMVYENKHSVNKSKSKAVCRAMDFCTNLLFSNQREGRFRCGLVLRHWVQHHVLLVTHYIQHIR